MRWDEVVQDGWCKKWWLQNNKASFYNSFIIITDKIGELDMSEGKRRIKNKNKNKWINQSKTKIKTFNQIQYPDKGSILK